MGKLKIGSVLRYIGESDEFSTNGSLYEIVSISKDGLYEFEDDQGIIRMILPGYTERNWKIMENTVFVIIGESGDYSDYSMWIAGATTCRKDAKEFVNMLEERVVSLRSLRKTSGWSSPEFRRELEISQKLDRNLDYDVVYYYREISLDDIPEILKRNG